MMEKDGLDGRIDWKWMVEYSDKIKNENMSKALVLMN